MRAIPPTITDATMKQKLLQISQQIDEKMMRVNAIRSKMKKKDFTSAELDELKKLGAEIDQLDQQWKKLVA
jgi:hypothetical protein